MRNLIKGIVLVNIVALSFACNKDTVEEENLGPQKSNIQQFITVNRDAGSDAYSMSFTKQGHWKIYKGTSPETIDNSTVVAETSESSIEITGLDSQKRYYFEVVYNDKEKTIVSETGLALEGQKNFRDLGGIISQNGKSVKWGKVFRSGELNNLTDADVQYIGSVNISKLVDFRDNSEIEEAPDNIPEGIETINIPIKQTVFNHNMIASWLIMNDSLVFDTLLVAVNKQFVRDFQNEYSGFFDLLETGESNLFHCTAGKDRTGLATVLFLSALDVDKETIIEDYLASNEYNTEMIEQTIEYVNSQGLNGELLRPILEVRLKYIEAAYEVIDNEYGGMANYLDLLGVDREKLKSLFLE